MVIVLNHAIVAAFLYYKDRSRFTPGGADHPPTDDGDTAQAITRKLIAASNLQELKVACEAAIIEADPAVTHTWVCFDGNDTGNGTNSSPCILTTEGLIWKAFSRKQKTISFPRQPNHPVNLSDFTGAVWDTSNSVIVCCPVHCTGKQRAVGVIVAICDKFDQKVDLKLDDIENQASQTYQRLKLQHMGTDNTRDSAILQLCAELYDSDAESLQLKVIKYLQLQTDAEVAFLLLLDKQRCELFCQVVGDNVLEEELRFPWANSCLEVALKRKQPITNENIDNGKLKEIEEFLGRNVESLLCVPVTSKADGSLIALVCVTNKKDGTRFGQDAIHTIHHCFQYTATVLTSTIAFQNERKLKSQTEALLQVARNLFTHLDDLTKLLREIMQEARNLTQAERCSVFLIEKDTSELVAKVFDGISTDDNQPQSEIRFPITQGIAGYVATKGELLNIVDAYSHPLFYSKIDENTGFRTRNILCFPIKDEKGIVIGVAQLCNKKIGPGFTPFDEAIASAFAVYCCISISHSLMYHNLRISRQRSKLSNELMTYHMKVSPEEVERLLEQEMTPSRFLMVYTHDLDKFSFSPRSLLDSDTTEACLFMFKDLGFITKWRIRKDTLARFLMMVKRGYRDPPYHNWAHAFSVGHFCYLLEKNILLHKYLDDIEIFALFVSCLCHDIDHRGTNNSFQVASKSVLAALYCSEGSVMERHHFAQSMCILNSEGCNIFENLSSKDYQTILDLMREIILATDLAHHLRILKSLEKMVTEGYDKTSTSHRKLLRSLLMTSCDLSDQTKDWNVAKHIAGLIYQEFFSQGDLEKALGQKPMEMMDRDRAKIPELQISFLDNIALPVFSLLARLFNKAKEVEFSVIANRRRWQKIIDLLHTRGQSVEKLTLDEILALEIDDENPLQERETS